MNDSLEARCVVINLFSYFEIELRSGIPSSMKTVKSAHQYDKKVTVIIFEEQLYLNSILLRRLKDGKTFKQETQQIYLRNQNKVCFTMASTHEMLWNSNA